MRAITRQRLLRVANEVRTMDIVRRIAPEIYEAHEQMEKALKKRDISLLSESIRAAKKSVEKLRYVLRGKS